ncbi:uncharacterized protein BX664DRAFT_293978 [Halteromyces radiatus]|uniref:uncharacterized protein n=1 Tax=Halteromyces radiatus TaxID=101107 RepID=UPI00221ED165|nr:uncharacterized protein BX664DRAFT_293978 [Halteromyces radiatus]KAI8092725.1 hypothetical protein BX664DRAFT_293978 [Halteromyces radiatus]
MAMLLLQRSSLTIANTQRLSSLRNTFILSRRLFSNKTDQETTIYTGPLSGVAKKLKLFSVTSLGLGCGISPFVYIIDVPVPLIAKTALVGAAIATSAASTGLIQWVMSPYVTKITTNNASDPKELTIHTLSFLAKDHITKVPVNALVPSTRIFTSLMVSDMEQTKGFINNKSAKPKALFYIHPEICQDEGSSIKKVIDQTGVGQGF